jgi:uncharacterized protein (DUF433 family)
LACLKVLHGLRNDSKGSLPHLRDVKGKLAALGEDLWAKTTLFVLDRRVVIVHPETRKREDALSGQAVLKIPLKQVTSTLEADVAAMMKRDKSLIGQVTRRRGIAGSQLVIAGTRVPVGAIKAFREAGYTPSQIREQYPALTDQDIKAALAYGKAA